MSDENIERTLGQHDAKLNSIDETLKVHSKKLDEVKESVDYTKNSTSHISTHLGELRQMLKDTQVNHEGRIVALEKSELIEREHNVHERLTTLENKVNRAFWYGLGTLGTAATALAVGLTTYWHKISGLFHGN